MYNCYAWGFTIFFLIVALITNFAEGNHYKPGIGDSSCWFNGNLNIYTYKNKQHVYGLGPNLLKMVFVLLFLLTNYYIDYYSILIDCFSKKSLPFTTQFLYLKTVRFSYGPFNLDHSMFEIEQFVTKTNSFYFNHRVHAFIV